ncbi:hypothetical protein ACN20G_34410 (plasmid) [Streptomyces sp. BI20]|uniref:hypothetical protein n=1 Tax=Streptomyces sp. BI20 TaxID=3403460 RepID=UPI003C728049
MALYLRGLVDRCGTTVRELERVMPYGKSTISENLSGRIPPRGFVDALVKATVREPRLRAVETDQAHTLLRAARNPTGPLPAVRPAAGGEATLAVAHERTEKLLRALERNTELEKDRLATQQIVFLLVTLIGHLQDEATTVRAAQSGQRAEITTLTEYLHTARTDLKAARRARHEAEALAAQARREAATLREELARLRIPAPNAEEGAPGAVGLPPELGEEFFLADVERALATAESFLHEGAELRERVADDLAETPAPTTPDGDPADPGLMRVLILLLCRTVGILLVTGGAVLQYAVTTWVSPRNGGLGSLLIGPGVLFMLDPWEVYLRWWPALRARVHRTPNPPRWNITLRHVLDRALRLCWTAATAIGAVCVLATVAWWPLWWLIPLLPTTLATTCYALAGHNHAAITALTRLLRRVKPAR